MVTTERLHNSLTRDIIVRVAFCTAWNLGVNFKNNYRG